jgi:hypothetical protein
MVVENKVLNADLGHAQSRPIAEHRKNAGCAGVSV